MSAILLNILNNAQKFQDSTETNFCVLATTLDEFISKLNTAREQLPSNHRDLIDKRIRAIAYTRDLILHHQHGQLPFWEQMVRTEQIAHKLLSTSQDADRQDTEKKFAKTLKQFYDALFLYLRKTGSAISEEPPIIGKGKALIGAYLEAITDLMEHVKSDEELISCWIQVNEAPDQQSAQALVEGLIKELNIKQLEESIRSGQRSAIQLTLLTFSLQEIPLNDKLRLLKLGIERCPIDSYKILIDHEAFNCLSAQMYRDLLSYAQEKNAMAHEELIRESDGYQISQFEETPN